MAKASEQRSGGPEAKRRKCRRCGERFEARKRSERLCEECRYDDEDERVGDLVDLFGSGFAGGFPEYGAEDN